MHRTVRSVLAATIVACAGLAAVAVGTGAAPAPEQVGLQQLAEQRANTLVTIKFILKSPEGEQEEEASGVLISGEGLVLSSNFSLGGGPFGGDANPTEIKVLVGEDTQGVDATFIARDTELGLAWVRIDKAPPTPYAFVDFKDNATVAVGDRLLSVQKLGKFFGLANWVAETSVGALPTKPRSLIIPSGTAIAGELAVPVYNGAGKAVGITTFVLPDEEEMKDARQSLMRVAQLGMILPAADVVTATTNAMEQAKNAPKVEEKPADAKPGEAPKAGEKPAEPAPGAPK
ncbi:MAG: S1C family serine protease [Phycisphaerales bacterium]